MPRPSDSQQPHILPDNTHNHNLNSPTRQNAVALESDRPPTQPSTPMRLKLRVGHTTPPHQNPSQSTTTGVLTRKRRRLESPQTNPPDSQPPSSPAVNPASPTQTEGDNNRPKRRRPPAPLSVTTAFSPPNLPTSCRALWEWPVISWYLGDVNQSDLALTTDRPFQVAQSPSDRSKSQLQHVHPAPATPTSPSDPHSSSLIPAPAPTPTAVPVANIPLPMHYRLRWLLQDASALIDSRPPPPPPPTLPLISNPLKDSSPACARPSSCFGPSGSSAPGTSGSARKRKSRGRQKSTTFGSARIRKRKRISQPDPVPDITFLPDIDNSRPPLPPVPPATTQISNLLLQETSKLPALSSDIRLVPSTEFKQEHSCPDPLGQSQRVCLQIVGPSQPEVLGNLHYAITAGPSSRDRPQVQLDQFNLEFRNKGHAGRDPFSDVDNNDELAKEIELLETKREASWEKSRSVRQLAEEALKTALAQQAEHESMVKEAIEIRERLAQISKEKAAVARAGTAASRSRRSTGLGTSARGRSCNSRRKSRSSAADSEKEAPNVKNDVRARGAGNDGAAVDAKAPCSDDAECTTPGDETGIIFIESNKEFCGPRFVPAEHGDATVNLPDKRNQMDKALYSHGGQLPTENVVHLHGKDEVCGGMENAPSFHGSNGCSDGSGDVKNAKVQEKRLECGDAVVDCESGGRNLRSNGGTRCLSRLDQVPSPVSPLQAVSRTKEPAVKGQSKA